MPGRALVTASALGTPTLRVGRRPGCAGTPTLRVGHCPVSLGLLRGPDRGPRAFTTETQRHGACTEERALGRGLCFRLTGFNAKEAKVGRPKAAKKSGSVRLEAAAAQVLSRLAHDFSPVVHRRGSTLSTTLPLANQCLYERRLVPSRAT